MPAELIRNRPTAQQRARAITSHKRNRGVDDSSAPPLSLICSYLQPEQEAQQSAEEQQFACVALAVPATPSAITATINITFNVFIVFSFRSGKSCG
jgi:hypothetical protein